MTAREFQDGLPPAAVAYRIAEGAGITKKAWGQMVWREQELTLAQVEALQASLLATAETFSHYARGIEAR